MRKAMEGVLARGPGPVLLLAVLFWQAVPGLAQSNVALNKPVQVSEQYSTDVATNAVDGQAWTRWNAGRWTSPEQPAWIQVDLQGTFRVTQIVLRTNNQGEHRGKDINYQLFAASDGGSWTLVAQGRLIDQVDPFHNINMNMAAIRYLRFNVVGGSHWGHLNEIEVYSPDRGGGGQPVPIGGRWSFGREPNYHLADLVLTDIQGQYGYVIQGNRHGNESFWRLDATGELLLIRSDGTVTSRLFQMDNGYWSGPYLLPSSISANLRHYLRR